MRMLSQELSRAATAEDAAVLSQLRQGEPEAWRTVSATVRQQLRNRAAATLPAEVAPRADASDIVQQTLAQAAISFNAFHGNTLPELYVWMAAILNHKVSDAIREHLIAQRRTVRLECRLDDSSHAGAGWNGVSATDQTSPSMAASRGEDDERLHIAIDSLPPRQREAVRMRHLEGRPLRDISARLDCSIQAAAAVLARGLRSLRDALKELD